MNWLRRLIQVLSKQPRRIDAALWQPTLAQYPFLATLTASEQAQLQTLCEHFLAQKEFHGVGLAVTDAMALGVAAQACLPLLHMRGTVQQRLAWYDDFVTINLYPGDMRARRAHLGNDGVMQHYTEDLSGEAMEGGPVSLNWADVAAAGSSANEGYNLVVHEFVHKMDMQSGEANGCPPLGSAAATRHWLQVLHAEQQKFADALSLHQRFGAPAPFLDPYAAEHPSEFFAVAAEAYFVNRAALEAQHPGLALLFDSFFLSARP